MNKNEHTKAGLVATDLIVEVFRLNGALIKSGDHLVKSLDLTSARWQIIGALAMAEMPQTVPQIARQMGLSRQAVQRIANDLVQKDWISYQEMPSDKRTRLLDLTPKGLSIYEQASARQVLWINEICDDLPVGEISMAKKLLKKLYSRCLEFDLPNLEDDGNK